MATFVNSDGGLWAGEKNEQIKGDGVFYAYDPVSPLRNNLVTKSELEKYLAQQPAQVYYVNGQPQVGTQTNTNAPVVTAHGFDLQAFFMDNKLLVLGGLAVIAFMFMSANGGGLAEVSTVRRYNKK